VDKRRPAAPGERSGELLAGKGKSKPMSVVFLLVFLVWLLVLVLAVLGRILRLPGRAVRICVRPLPWPRIDIRVEAEPPNRREARTCGAQSPDRQVSTG
jgi:hypothetical protein